MRCYIPAVFFLLTAPALSLPPRIWTPPNIDRRDTALPTHATWLWKSEIIADASSVAQFLSFASSHNISRVHAQVNSDIPTDIWASFISRCATSDISVEALFGDAQWITGAGTPSLQTTLDWIQSYQGSAADNAKFVGLHMDIEPWNLDDYSMKTSTYLSSWQTLITNISSFASSLSLPLAADLPFWLNTLNSPTNSQTMDTWVLERIDSATFMTYRNSASELSSIASGPIQAAQSLSKTVWVAVETTDLGVADNKVQSYYGQSDELLARDLATVGTWAAQYSLFKGVSVHDYTGWTALV